MWISQPGEVHFTSDAPLEIIQAESKSLKGAIDVQKKSFAFSMPINSFQGFNSDIQRTHFLENYLEQKKYPSASFKGKIIEDIPFDQNGVYTIRAKGILDIHGVEKERIVKGELTINSDGVFIETDFTIPLIDHNIAIPRIVQQKIAEVISVHVKIFFSSDAQ